MRRYFKIHFVVFAISIAVLVSTFSCRRVRIIPGRFEFISATDSILSGNSVITGHVRSYDGFPAIASEVWIESLNVNGQPNASGEYSLLVPPGTYVIKCQSMSNRYKELLLEVKDQPAGKNQKTVIDFYLGQVIE